MSPARTSNCRWRQSDTEADGGSRFRQQLLSFNFTADIAEKRDWSFSNKTTKPRGSFQTCFPPRSTRTNTRSEPKRAPPPPPPLCPYSPQLSLRGEAVFVGGCHSHGHLHHRYIFLVLHLLLQLLLPLLLLLLLQLQLLLLVLLLLGIRAPPKRHRWACIQMSVIVLSRHPWHPRCQKRHFHAGNTADREDVPGGVQGKVPRRRDPCPRWPSNLIRAQNRLANLFNFSQDRVIVVVCLVWRTLSRPPNREMPVCLCGEKESRERGGSTVSGRMQRRRHPSVCEVGKRVRVCSAREGESRRVTQEEGGRRRREEAM